MIPMTCRMRDVISPAASRQMKLWSYNLGYEHHEQKPIAFGVVKKAQDARCSENQIEGLA